MWSQCLGRVGVIENDKIMWKSLANGVRYTQFENSTERSTTFDCVHLPWYLLATYNVDVWLDVLGLHWVLWRE